MNSGEQIEVATGARLHFGLICGTEDAGWKFGGVGLMVREPGWRLRLTRMSESREPCQVSGVPDCVAQRIQSTIEHCRKRSDAPPPAFAVEVTAGTPLHSGYGAGTQLALAVGTAIHTLSNRRIPDDFCQLSQLLGRAGRSAIGTAGFQSGGFLVDRGVSGTPIPSKTPGGFAGGRVQRVTVPDEWRFVLIRPTQSTGLSGADERAFFDRCQTMTPGVVQTLVTLIGEELLPAVSGNDFPRFAAALAAYGQTVGSFYASQQGDVFSHPAMRIVADFLTANGFPGAAQSSWGPGICIPAADTECALRMQALVRSHAQSAQLTVQITEPLNCGATIRTRAPEQNESRRLV